MSARRPILRIGTRGSALALWQARHVAALLGAVPGTPPTVIETVRTTGDAVTDIPLSQVDGKGFFTKELDEALLEGRIDLAVHSLKDVATALPPGVDLVAIPVREDPRDVLVAKSGTCSLATLARGARVGTSSVRRHAFLRHHRPDLDIAELRGNVPTRVERLDAGRYDAIVVAAAGLIRLGLAERIGGFLDPVDFPPAPAQGVLGLCARASDRATVDWLRPLEHAVARAEATAERAFLSELEAGCQVPAGALARVDGDRLRIAGVTCEPDGRHWRRAALEAPVQEAERIGRALARGLRVADFETAS